MILITSADYVVDELKVEFGSIPPSFLPIGNLRLFKHQVAIIRKFISDDIYLSIPSSFDIKSKDLSDLGLLDLKIVRVPEKLSLGESISYVLNGLTYKSQKLYILHGDTLITDFPVSDDFISISSEVENYSWEYDSSSNRDSIWCGLFSFSNLSFFENSLKEVNHSFIDAVKLYSDFKFLKRIESKDWSDFGHVVTYYKSRCRKTTERSFNSLKIIDGIVTKKSVNNKKILGEISWFENLPSQLKIFTPSLIEFNKVYDIFYSLEYLYIPTLAELFVFGVQNKKFWINIMDKCFQFLSISSSLTPNTSSNVTIQSSKSLIIDKTIDRVILIEASGIWDLNEEIVFNGIISPSINSILENLYLNAFDNDIIYGYMHGDFCFSNILYDIRSNRIKVIDPRGMNSINEISLFGDLYYDYSKLSHSILGCYDYIIAEMFFMNIHSNNNYEFEIDIDDRTIEIQEEFVNQLLFRGLNYKKIYAQMILLFISMIPLHSDNVVRQKAFILNTYRLYNIWIKI